MGVEFEFRGASEPVDAIFLVNIAVALALLEIIDQASDAQHEECIDS